MKKWMQGFIVLFAVVMASLTPVIAFAAEAAAVTVQGQGSPLDKVLETVVTIAISIFAGLAAYAGKFIKHKIEEAQASKKALWVDMAMKLAGAGVAYAEKKWGRDTGKGTEKREDAIQFVLEHFVVGKVKLTRKQAEDFVDSLYQMMEDAASPLAVKPAPVSSQG